MGVPPWSPSPTLPKPQDAEWWPLVPTWPWRPPCATQRCLSDPEKELKLTIAIPMIAQSFTVSAIEAMCISMMGLPQIHSFADLRTLVAALTTLHIVGSMTTSASHSSTTIVATLITPLVVLSNLPSRAHSKTVYSRILCTASCGNMSSTTMSRCKWLWYVPRVDSSQLRSMKAYHPCRSVLFSQPCKLLLCQPPHPLSRGPTSAPFVARTQTGRAAFKSVAFGPGTGSTSA